MGRRDSEMPDRRDGEREGEREEGERVRARG